MNTDLPETGELTPRGRLRGLVAVTSSMAMTAMMFGFSWPMFSTRLAEMGVSEARIGIHTAVQGVGIFVVAWFTPRLITRFGPARLMLAMTAINLTAVLLCIPFQGYWPWLVLRFVIGAAGSVLWVAGETWVNQTAREESRGRELAIYSAALGLGTVLGVKILEVVGYQGNLPFLTLAGAVVLVALPLLAALDVSPRIEVGDHRPGLWGLAAAFRGAPLSILLNTAFAAVFAGVETFMSVYALKVGMPVDRAFELLMVFNLGGIVLPYAVGWLADRMDRALLSVWLVVASTALLAVMGRALAVPDLDNAYMLVVGGLSAGIYAVAMALLGERFRGAALASAATLFTLMWNLGSLVGPLVTGAAMQRFGPAAMPWTLAVMAALVLPLAIGAWLRRRARSRSVYTP